MSSSLALATPSKAGSHYQSSFKNWDSRSSVRTKPQRDMSSTDGHILFPPEFVPALAHPLVAARGTAARDLLLTHVLYQYLHFTTVLEQTAVLPVTAQISLGCSGLSLPEAMRRDAFKITTDEAWHAQFSYDFLHEAARATGVQPTLLTEPPFVRRTAEARDGVEPSVRRLTNLFFAIVSETLISRILAGIPNDKRLPAPVRALVADHAADEGRHHAYFRSFLGYLWPRLSSRERQMFGSRVPEYIQIFLDPDVTSVIRMLREVGLTTGETALVVAESYPRHDRRLDMRSAASGTIRAFRDVGALDDPVIYDAFAAKLITDGYA